MSHRCFRPHTYFNWPAQDKFLRNMSRKSLVEVYWIFSSHDWVCRPRKFRLQNVFDNGHWFPQLFSTPISLPVNRNYHSRIYCGKNDSARCIQNVYFSTQVTDLVHSEYSGLCFSSVFKLYDRNNRLSSNVSALFHKPDVFLFVFIWLVPSFLVWVDSCHLNKERYVGYFDMTSALINI